MPQHAGQALAAIALHAPYLGTAHHHASSRHGLAYLEEAFFGIAPAPPALRVLCFSDTYDELNGVAGTMRRLSAEGARRGELTVVTSREQAVDAPGLLAVPATRAFRFRATSRWSCGSPPCSSCWPGSSASGRP